MSAPVRLAVAGLGLVGRRHAAAIGAAEGAALACCVDPADAARAFAEARGVCWHPSVKAMIAAGGVDGAILATPNALHVEGGLACVAAGLPMLVEKPVASDLSGARRLVAAAERAGVALAVGHQRRHNPLVAKAHELIAAGALGRVVAAHAQAWLMKPEDYFEADWRRRRGAGPVLVNLIHDVDLLGHLCGPIAQVQAVASSAERGFEVEDTAAVLLRFASGALGTLGVSDTAVSPWSWELTARENPAHPATAEDCCRIGGTHGSLALPSLTLWTHRGGRSWWEPIAATRFPLGLADPLVRQVEQFVRVVRDGAAPLVGGRDGLAALEVVEAVHASAASGAPVEVGAGRGP